MLEKSESESESVICWWGLLDSQGHLYQGELDFDIFIGLQCS